MISTNLYITPLSRVSGLLKPISRFFIRVFSAFILLGFISSCNSSDDLSSNWSAETVDKAISVNVRQNAGFQSENTAGSDFESRLQDMHVLVFLAKSGDKGVADPDNLIYYNMARISNISNTGTSKTFDMKLYFPYDAKRLSLVFVANPRSLNVDNFKNKTLSEISDQFDFEVFGDSKYVWDMANPATIDAESLPMSGYLDVEVADLKKLDQIDVELRRSVARVDIGFRYSVDDNGIDQSRTGANTFNGENYFIKSVYTYRISKSGLILAPKASDSNVPSLVKISETPYVVQLSKETAEPIKNKIYIPENRGGLVASGEQSITTFVVGVYNEKFKSPDKIRYFKINRGHLIQGKLSFADISRNKRIVISIDDIKGDGYRTPDEALKGEADLNTTITVVDWINASKDIDGQGGYPGFKWKDDNLSANDSHDHRLGYFNLTASNPSIRYIYIYGGAIPKSFETKEFELVAENDLANVNEKNLWKITVTSKAPLAKFKKDYFLEFSNHKVPITVYQGVIID